MKSDSIVYEKSFKFAKRIIKLYKFLVYEKKERVISHQIMKSGTSIGANISKATYAQSKKDFVNKMLGNWMEYQFDAVINSRRFAVLLPSRWVKSVHRSEYGIQDTERGSPDRIVLNNEGKFNALISVAVS